MKGQERTRRRSKEKFELLFSAVAGLVLLLLLLRLSCPPRWYCVTRRETKPPLPSQGAKA